MSSSGDHAMTIDGTLVAREQRQLRDFWADPKGAIAATIGKAAFGHLHAGRGAPINLRHFHNRFGWQANRRSPCEGALYRSERFMGQPPAARSGSKAAQTVHIEHTVPIATLMTLFRPAPADRPVETIGWLLAHSIATAVSDGDGEERHTMVTAGQHRQSFALTPGHAQADRPFARYAADRHSPIWDLVRGVPVDPATFSFADHAANMAVVLRWAGLEDWVGALAPAR